MIMSIALGSVWYWKLRPHHRVVVLRNPFGYVRSDITYVKRLDLTTGKSYPMDTQFILNNFAEDKLWT